VQDQLDRIRLLELLYS